jgi:argininosuccinate lyase
VIAAGTALLITAKGLPLAYNKDLQETQEPVFEAAATVVELLQLAAGFMRDVQFDLARMQAAASSGFMNAMAAAAYLVRRGVPFRRAHEQIGRAVQLCLEKHCELQDLSLNELRQFGAEFEEDFYAHLTLESVLACHDVAGGAAPARVRDALAQTRARLAALRGGFHAHA